MKTISTILAAVLCASSPLLAQEESNPTPTPAEQPASQAKATERKLGKEAVSAIRQAYKNGDHDQFLKEMDDAYQTALSQNQLSDLIEMRQIGPIPSGDLPKWEERYFQLSQAKNKDLLNLISDQDDSLVAQKIRSSAATLSTPEQEAAIAKLALFRVMTPNSGENSDENRVIELDMEYEYKALHIYAQQPDEPSSVRREKQAVLKMEKLDKLLAASKNFQDSSLKLAIGVTASNFDERLAQSWDAMDLKEMSKENSSGDLQKKASSVLASYQSQYIDLYKQYISEQDAANSEAKK